MTQHTPPSILTTSPGYPMKTKTCPRCYGWTPVGPTWKALCSECLVFIYKNQLLEGATHEQACKFANDADDAWVVKSARRKENRNLVIFWIVMFIGMYQIFTS